MFDTLHRYFVGNTAPILSIERTKLATSFVRTRCGNADGFYWGNWQVMWRKPYHSVWSYHEGRWVPTYTLTPTTGGER